MTITDRTRVPRSWLLAAVLFGCVLAGVCAGAVYGVLATREAGAGTSPPSATAPAPAPPPHPPGGEGIDGAWAAVPAQSYVHAAGRTLRGISGELEIAGGPVAAGARLEAGSASFELAEPIKLGALAAAGQEQVRLVGTASF